MNTCYDQLAAIKARFGYIDLSKPVRAAIGMAMAYQHDLDGW